MHVQEPTSWFGHQLFPKFGTIRDVGCCNEAVKKEGMGIEDYGNDKPLSKFKNLDSRNSLASLLRR